MVSNLLVEIVIYNFDLFHSALDYDMSHFIIYSMKCLNRQGSGGNDQEQKKRSRSWLDWLVGEGPPHHEGLSPPTAFASGCWGEFFVSVTYFHLHTCSGVGKVQR